MTALYTAAIPSTVLDVADEPAGTLDETLQSAFENMLDDGMLRRALRRTLVQQAVTRAREILGRSLTEVLVTTWKKHDELVAAAQRTAAEPNSDAVVDLATHTVKAASSYVLDAMVNGAQIFTVTLAVEVLATVRAAVAVVADGRLMEITSGDTDITVTITLDGAPIASRGTTLDLPVILDLGEGYDLLS